MRPAEASVLFALIATGCVPRQAPDANMQAYQESIISAALKEHAQSRPLESFDPAQPTVRVAHLQPYPSIDTKRFVWVSHPAELRSFCWGRPDALLAMEQALGMPPDENPAFRVFTFDVSPESLFRSCASSPDIRSESCSADLPQTADPAHAASEHFVLKQMMDGYRIGEGTHGYPFTAMGWSYDWNPHASSAQGVSEYVMRPGATISHVSVNTPDAFCGQTGS